MKQKYKKIKGVCIKEYQDEDDVVSFEEGLIEEDEIKTYKVGEEGEIVEGYYDPEYWKPIKTN